MEITTGTPNWLKIVLRNSYVRATFVTLLLTAFLIMLFVSIGGPVQLLGGTAFLLGAFLAVVFFVMSIYSVSKQLRQMHISPASNNVTTITWPQPKSQPGSAAYYKRRLIWSLVVATPGVLIWLLALATTQNGGGEAFIVFIPLFFVSVVALFGALQYGIAYVYKKFKASA